MLLNSTLVEIYGKPVLDSELRENVTEAAYLTPFQDTVVQDNQGLRQAEAGAEHRSGDVISAFG